MEDSKLKDEAPKLFGLEKKNIYRIPEGFFIELEKDIRKQCARRKPGRINKLKKWIELSVAAVFVGFMLFSGIKIISGKKYHAIETDRSMYDISDQSMVREQVVEINSIEKQ